MTKSHLKRLAIPKTWPIKRRGITFVTRPFPAGHPRSNSIPLNIAIRDVLHKAQTAKQVRHILHNTKVSVDGKQRKNARSSAGLMDVISFEDAKIHARIVLEKNGKLATLPLTDKEKNLKVIKIIGKTMVKGKIQLNGGDGKNIFTEDKNIRVGDSILITIPENNIKEHLPFKKGAAALVVGGKHIGDTGSIVDVAGRKVMFKNRNNETIETLRKYMFIVGDKTPKMHIQQKENERNEKN